MNQLAATFDVPQVWRRRLRLGSEGQPLDPGCGWHDASLSRGQPRSQRGHTFGPSGHRVLIQKHRFSGTSVSTGPSIESRIRWFSSLRSASAPTPRIGSGSLPVVTQTACDSSPKASWSRRFGRTARLAVERSAGRSVRSGVCSVRFSSLDCEEPCPSQSLPRPWPAPRAVPPGQSRGAQSRTHT